MHEVLLHLSLIEHIGPSAILRLIKNVCPTDDSLRSLYAMSAAELKSLAQINEDRAQKLHAGLANRSSLDRELALADEYNISVVSILDHEYPPLLKNIHIPPLVLYIRGLHNFIFDQCIAIVGSRKANTYGQAVISLLVPDLIKRGWCIVSGGALGIDKMAHEEALIAEGLTIAVLGSGLLKPYPKAHKPLFTKIIESGGALVSSFPLLTEPLPGLFPARNRIIAGLSRGCVVVQAGIPSGALITAQHALNEGREVFAVPGAINDPLSAGCHKLISEGATLVADIDHLCDAFDMGAKQLELLPRKEMLQKKNVQIAANEKPEQRILKLCAQPISFEDLVAYTGIENTAMQDILCDLNLAGKIMQDRLGLWCLA